MKLHSSIFVLLAAAVTSTSWAASAPSGLRGNHDQQAQENNAKAVIRSHDNADISAVRNSGKNEEDETGGLNILGEPEQSARALLSEDSDQEEDEIEPKTSVLPPSNKFGLNAHQLGRVHTANGDYWEMNSSYEWTEFKADKKTTFKWKELSRDVNSVYLRDNNGRQGTTAKVDLYWGTIVYCPQKNNCVDLRTITSAHKINKFGLKAPDLSRVTTRNKDQWVYSGRGFLNLGYPRWTEIKASGQRSFQWRETHRDIHSVYLVDNNGRTGTTAQIDLHVGVIVYCPQIGNCITLQEITAAS